MAINASPRPAAGPDHAAGSARPERPGATNPSLVVAVLAFAGLGGALVQTMTSPALPAIAASFGVATADASWVLTALLLSAAIATPIVGRLGDAFGTRPMVVGCWPRARPAPRSRRWRRPSP